MLSPTAKGATKITAARAARMSQKANSAVTTVHRAVSPIRTIAQDVIQRQLILPNKRTSAVVLMPIFAKRKKLPDGYDKNAKFSVTMLSVCGIPSSYSLDAKTSSGRARIFYASRQNQQQRIDATAQRDTNRQAWQLDECAIGSSVRVTKTRDGLSLTLRPSDADVNSVGKGWKMAPSNGRWQVPDESGKRDDPDRDFPIRQTFTDYSGQARHFVISYFRANLGFGVQAEEEGKDGEGYFFREFDPNSPYLALGRIRGRIRTALATRHIEQQEPGDFQATHQTVRGRISYAAGEVGFVIDGQFLTLQQFGKMVETFEGWEFRLDILD